VQGDAVPGNNGVFYLLGDHLGSTSIVADSSGSSVSELRYRAFGETRFAGGTTPTDYRYTGQREESLIGLYDYGARWYDPAVGHFVQADTIVPTIANPQALDRYGYGLNNPVRYSDPSGHRVCDDFDAAGNCITSPGSPAGGGAGGGNGGDVGGEGGEAGQTDDGGPDAFGYNIWDLVPGVGELRGMHRGWQTMSWAHAQRGFYEEQLALQAWYNCSYGLCHYASATALGPQTTGVGGPMPLSLHVDVYSAGMGDLVGNGVQFGIELLMLGAIRRMPELEPNVTIQTRSGSQTIVRVAPAGNRAPLDLGDFRSVSGNLPHWHAQVRDVTGRVLDFQGVDWHRPWDDFFYWIVGRRP